MNTTVEYFPLSFEQKKYLLRKILNNDVEALGRNFAFYQAEKLVFLKNEIDKLQNDVDLIIINTKPEIKSKLGVQEGYFIFTLRELHENIPEIFSSETWESEGIYNYSKSIDIMKPYFFAG